MLILGHNRMSQLSVCLSACLPGGSAGLLQPDPDRSKGIIRHQAEVIRENWNGV